MHRGVWINEASGPQFITRELDTMEGLARDVTLFHSDVFLPYVINEAALPPDQYPHAYGIHHYASSWVPEKSRQYTQAQWTSRRYRLLIAADWSASEQLVAIVDAYARLIPESAQVDLVFVTASDPTEADVTALQSILERRSHGGLAGVRLEAVREAASVSHDTYFVPSRGDSSTGLADLIVRMAEIGSLTMDYPRPALANLAQFRVEKGKSHEFLAAIHNWATSPAGADRS